MPAARPGGAGRKESDPPVEKHVPCTPFNPERMSPVTPALKEWAVVIRALDEGKQVLLLRKGGIAEPTGQFRIEHDRFFFYPTYEHQKPHLIKPAFREAYAQTLAAAPPAGQVAITHLAQVTDVVQVRGQEAVSRLSPHYIYTEDYAQERLHWKPNAPLYVVFVRVLRLPEPRWIPIRPEYSGCTSWIELVEPIDASGAMPVLSDTAYEAAVAAARASLGP